MTRERADAMLAGYREDKARAEYLATEIGALTRLRDGLQSNIVEAEISITAPMTGMPHGGKISDPTARLGDMLADGITPQSLRDLTDEINQLGNERERRMYNVSCVNAWMDGLTDRERFVAEHKVLGGETWRETIAVYNERYGVVYSKQGLKNVLTGAMLKIYRIAGVDKS